jgi:predicted nucleic acid-binding protein
MERLTEDEALTAISDFQQYDITRCDFREIQTLAFQLAYQHRCSVYDGAYIALAQTKRLWFYTGDKKLFNAVGRILPWVQLIGDFNFDAITIDQRL